MPELRDLDPLDARERMAALFRYSQVGLCVSSVTHDINNYLGAILAYTELIEMAEELSPEGRRMLHEILEGVRRCTSVLSTLTTVARRDAPAVAVVDGGKLLNQVAELRNHELRFQQIQLELNIEEGVPGFVADLPKLELALIYLFTNACEAVHDQEIKKVRSGLRLVDHDLEFSFWNSGAPVPEADREAMFLPFTTSKAGAHLGLGLAMARDIAQLHNGSLVYSPQRGFVMTLPRQNDFGNEIG